MATLYVQSPTLYLAGSGVVVGATSITLTSLVDIYGNVLTMANFGAIGYITLEPDTSNAEAATFTGVTANANGTYTLTGVKTLLAVSPYTATSGLVRNHSGGTKVVVTDNIAFWNTFPNKNNDETILGKYTFPGDNTNRPANSTDIDTATATHLVTFGQLARTTITGSVAASTTTLGGVKLSTNPVSATSPIVVGDNDTRVPTQSENDALVGNNIDIAVGSGNKYVTQTGLQKNSEKYAADAGASDTYAITLSPVPTSYATGMQVIFKANTVNTGAATLNVNSLGAKTIVKNVSTTLEDGDIQASQICTVVYDGTNFVLQNPTQRTGFLASGAPGTVTTNATATVLTYTLPANTLQTNKGVRIRISIIGTITTTNNGATYTISYGGTTIGFTGYQGGTGTPTVTANVVLDLVLMGAGTTNSQRSNGLLRSTITSGSGGSAVGGDAQIGSAAVDSTVNQDIVVSCTAGANATGQFIDYLIQKII